VGGGADPNDLYGLPVRVAELYDPVLDVWTEMASQAANRTYHSTALLLPDGRVISAGSDGGDMPRTVEYYSPPYLFKGPRPTITQSPPAVGYGQRFRIDTPEAADIVRVTLIRLGSATHSVNFEQRQVDLAFVPQSGRLAVRAPASANLAPPGDYMLFILNSDGVPSIAPIIHVE
jgi:galactose oxidase